MVSPSLVNCFTPPILPSSLERLYGPCLCGLYIHTIQKEKHNFSDTFQFSFDRFSYIRQLPLQKTTIYYCNHPQESNFENCLYIFTDYEILGNKILNSQALSLPSPTFYLMFQPLIKYMLPFTLFCIIQQNIVLHKIL